MKKILSSIWMFLIPVSNVLAHGLSEEDKQNMIDGGLARYGELGASHMLTGYDHLLFLFGVIFFLTKFKDIVRFVTAFTLGHSVTLIFATFLNISANYFLIDAVIALTVFYKGFDNIDGFNRFLGMKSPNLIKLVFVFGLIHGFGLSTRLQQLPLGDEGLLLKIIAFNVGVEIGQISALSIMIILLMGWRKTASFKKFSVLANSGLMLAGIFLFFMQLHGYSQQTFVDELAVSPDPHHDDHGRLGNDQVEVSKKESVVSTKSPHQHSHGGNSHDHEASPQSSPIPTPHKSVHSHGDENPHSH